MESGREREITRAKLICFVHDENDREKGRAGTVDALCSALLNLEPESQHTLGRNG